jgi:hypothetical protein
MSTTDPIREALSLNNVSQLLLDIKRWRHVTSLPKKIAGWGSLAAFDEWNANLWQRFDATVAALAQQPTSEGTASAEQLKSARAYIKDMEGSLQQIADCVGFKMHSGVAADDLIAAVRSAVGTASAEQEPVGIVQVLSIAGYPMPNTSGVEWLRPVPAGAKLYLAASPTAEQGAPAAPVGATYLTRLVDRLLMPPPSMPASEIAKLHQEAAAMLHMLARSTPPQTPAQEAQQGLGVPASPSGSPLQPAVSAAIPNAGERDQ